MPMALPAVGLNSEPDITPRQIEMMVQHFNKGEPGEYRIFCAHHSFLPVPTKKLKPGDVVPRSADILQTLIELNVDLLCCGHIHRSHVWDLSDGRHRLLCCNAGSLLDTSGKKDNGFLELTIERDLQIVKRSLFSRRTEVLYRRSHFGEILRDRQTLGEAGMMDKQERQERQERLERQGTPVDTTHEAELTEGRSKVKKTKGKK